MRYAINCTLPHHETQYAILIESGLLEGEELMKSIPPLISRLVIVTDDHVKEIIGRQLQNKLSKHGYQVELLSIPPGEKSKTRETKEKLENAMFEAKYGRDSCLIAVGGGVVTDLTGYLASTYCRGIPLIMIPSSLLCMVDASIGGKNGVDVPYGKNLIGTIYQPNKVLIDPHLLQTLPKREFSNGVVEMIKHGLIADPSYCHYLMAHAVEFMNLVPSVLEKAIHDSCQIKKNIVEEDEKETGKRRLLNLGHTIAHAIESLTHYEISHGEAVAIGILIEGYAAYLQGYLKKERLDEIAELFKLFHVPLRGLRALQPEEIITATALDKKNQKGASRYVLLKDIGCPVEFDGAYCTPIENKLLHEAINWYKMVFDQQFPLVLDTKSQIND